MSVKKILPLYHNEKQGKSGFSKFAINAAAIVVLSFLFIMCDSRQENAVYDLMAFRTEIKEHCSEYTESEWENAFNRYMEICQRLDEIPFTREERLEIEKIKGEIAGYATTVIAQEVSDEIINIVEEINSFSEGFSETFQTPNIREYDRRLN